MNPILASSTLLPAAAKKIWRESLRAERRQYLAAKGADVADDLKQLAEFAKPLLRLFSEARKPFDTFDGSPIHEALIIASYRAMAAELDPSPLENALQNLGHRVVWPRVEAKRLKFYGDNATPPFRLSPFGVQEPNAGATEFTPDIVLVPLVGLDRQGFRLGQGGGFYDQTLPHLNAFSVGLGFSCQIVDRLPHEPHDVPLNAVLTPSGLRLF
jgi:5-formyltetrahydrofolate cyclo-ligase